MNKINTIINILYIHYIMIFSTIISGDRKILTDESGMMSGNHRLKLNFSCSSFYFLWEHIPQVSPPIVGAI